MPSSVIRSFDYRAETRELDILFTTGRRYIYREVPLEAAEALRGAFAKGRHFNSRIRGRYPYSEIEGEPPTGSPEGKPPMNAPVERGSGKPS